jgi:hypothetical protein
MKRDWILKALASTVPNLIQDLCLHQQLQPYFHSIFFPGFQRTVLRRLATLINGQNDILERLDALEAKACVSSDAKGDNASVPDYNSLPEFPLDLESQLAEFDDQLGLATDFNTCKFSLNY